MSTAEPGRDGGSRHPLETVATFWAHYDDDLIFANPTLFEALDAGHRTRGFFFTASDAGNGISEYSEGRERGIRAAYDVMRGATGPWSDRDVVLGNGVTATATSPDGDDRVELIFLRLADGGLTGNGWFPTGYQTLPKTLAGEIPSMRTLDTGQDVTREQLLGIIPERVVAWNATTVITHHPGFTAPDGVDHPDHQTVGRLVASAVDAGLIDPDIVRYASGYDAAERPANLDPERLARKLETFAAYGAHDPVVARDDPREYLGVPGFGAWLQRQYLDTHAELGQSAG